MLSGSKESRQRLPKDTAAGALALCKRVGRNVDRAGRFVPPASITPLLPEGCSRHAVSLEQAAERATVLAGIARRRTDVSTGYGHQ